MKYLYILIALIACIPVLSGCSANPNGPGSTATGTIAPSALTMTPEQRQEVRAKMMGLQSTIQSKQQTTPAKPAQ
jgi:hypothetical protein